MEYAALRDQKARAIAEAEAQELKAQRVASGLPAEAFAAPDGARCCDQALFGRDWCWQGDATEVYEAAYRATTSRSLQQKEAEATAAEQEPLLRSAHLG